jgi:hypothetical protein
MDVDFGVEVVETKAKTLTVEALPQAVRGPSLAESLGLFTPLGQTNPTTIKVHMKIAREMPEGMARMGDLLADLLSARPAKALRVDDIPGASPEFAKRLRDRGILTISDFLAATERSDVRAEIARELGLSADNIQALRREARRLQDMGD